MNCTGESTRIQLESIEDLQYVLDNIYQYLIQEMPSQKENVEEVYCIDINKINLIFYVAYAKINQKISI